MKHPLAEGVVEALEAFFRACGTLAEYCVDLDDSGAINFIVCKGANFTDKKVLGLLEKEEIARGLAAVPEVRFIATRITERVANRVKEINPEANLTVVGIKEWRKDIDQVNRLGDIRYGRWPKAPDSRSYGNPTAPERYGLIPRKPKIGGTIQGSSE